MNDCLSFFTGALHIPVTGFDDECTLNFSCDNIFPTASTCSLTLTLPTLYHDRTIATVYLKKECSMHFLIMEVLDSISIFVIFILFITKFICIFLLIFKVCVCKIMDSISTLPGDSVVSVDPPLLPLHQSTLEHLRTLVDPLF